MRSWLERPFGIRFRLPTAAVDLPPRHSMKIPSLCQQAALAATRSAMIVAVMVSLLACDLSHSCSGQERPEFCVFPYRCPIAARLSPQVGQQGTEVRILLQGARLQEIQEVLFYRPGIRFVGFEPASKVPDDIHQMPIDAREGTAAWLTFQIEEDCPLGEHFLRVRTSDALSEMVSFWVTPFPCVAEQHLGHDSATASNGSIEMAQQVALGSSVYGYHPKNSTIDHDYYAVDLTAGQRFTVEVWSSCLGYQHFRAMSDIAITMYDPDGKRIAAVDDSSLMGMDPILNLTVERTGKYFVNIHQSMDFEGILRHYVAHFSDAPRPAITYPLGGQAGTVLSAVGIGDVRGDIPLTITLPEQPGAFEKALVEHRTGASVIPNQIKVARFGDVLEDGQPHFTPETAQRYAGELPIAFNGQILDEGKTDWFRFQAKKGQRYRVRTYAATLGSSLDAKLQIIPAPGTNSRLNLTADDSSWVDHDWYGNDKVWIIQDRMDPITVFEPDVDGEYLIGIHDSQRLFGPDYVYRIEFQPLTDRALVHFPTDYREAPNKRDRLVVPRGNTIEHTFAIKSATGNRYRGGMRLVAHGLPPGVDFSCPPLQPGQMLTQGVLTAGKDVKPWSGLIEFSLEPTEPDANFTGSYVHNVPSTQRRGGNNVVFNRVRRCALAVVQEAPFSVSVKQPTISLAQNAIIDLEVEVQRHDGFDGAVRLYAAWTPPGITVAVPLVIPAGQTKGVYRLQASGSVTPGQYPITLTAQEDQGGDRGWGTGFHYVASPPIQLSVVRPFLDIQLARSSIERMQEGTIQATIKTINPLPSEAQATLVRLPKGIELLSPVTIKPGQREAVFPIRATKDCLTGQYREIGCQIAIQAAGQTITQQTGNGTLRIDAER